MNAFDAGAEHFGDVSRPEHDQRYKAPHERIVGQPLQTQSRDTETEEEYDKDARQSAKDVDVDDCHQPERKEHRPWQAAHHREDQREDEDQRFRYQEELDIDHERLEQVRQ